MAGDIKEHAFCRRRNAAQNQLIQLATYMTQQAEITRELHSVFKTLRLVSIQSQNGENFTNFRAKTYCHRM
ncbi:hypothetical protein RvY_01508 [Ramazzottius varieornatus]|uniref:Uncharacterized protein n=1 Tax=Ramazzottius varieornatus TaxID=947166 RepID=A0A1D1UK28_RAMVA|nr:hypothetical protein RvY_01508 [Ramazzottius varieornatus]